MTRNSSLKRSPLKRLKRVSPGKVILAIFALVFCLGPPAFLTYYFAPRFHGEAVVTSVVKVFASWLIIIIVYFVSRSVGAEHAKQSKWNSWLSPFATCCVLVFGLEADLYAYSMDFPDPEYYNVVEIEVTDPTPSLLRADKSLVTRRIVDGKLTASIVDISSDARMYWSGYVESDLKAEILFCGKYQFTRIIRPAEDLVRPYLTNPDEILSRSDT